MASFYVMEAVNLFCGDHDPNDSKHLTIESLRSPTLEEMTADHTPGGSMMAITIGMSAISALEAGFKLAGYDPNMLSLFGLGGRKREVYTAYGVLRDKRTGGAIEVKSIYHARLATIEPDEFEKGELSGYDYSLKEILHYETYFDTREKYYCDFFNQTWRVDGVSQNAEERRILRIPGVG